MPQAPILLSLTRGKPAKNDSIARSSEVSLGPASSRSPVEVPLPRSEYASAA
jgi:hypothetical protein